MPLKKRFLKSKPQVKVTFELEKDAAGQAEKIFLLGEFNDWSPIELQKFKNGKFKATLDLPTDAQSEFEFKYKLITADGNEAFENEVEADGYRMNEFGTENSLLSVQPC
ncbi:isoamylase early set domain-containing protein [Motilimonas eburnea]|uniref:isoamylase early set domain-containing protein n=1 Tax=Motilimonas eburnea TaxID=1737488 RepID=UPI001E632D3A|nr:isoamylase early set domain-containing protein [Motilimonas eburnea]MCE2571397.1 isoamylase early set domain-containing protein [Motilimonas eburnea]